MKLTTANSTSKFLRIFNTLNLSLGLVVFITIIVNMVFFFSSSYHILNYKYDVEIALNLITLLLLPLWFSVIKKSKSKIKDYENLKYTQQLDINNSDMPLTLSASQDEGHNTQDNINIIQEVEADDNSGFDAYNSNISLMINSILFPFIITNKNGEIKTYNNVAQQLLGLEDGKSYNFSDFVEVLLPKEDNGVMVIKSLVKTANSSKVQFNILQSTVYKNQQNDEASCSLQNNGKIKEIEDVLLILLPETKAFSGSNQLIQNDLFALQVKPNQNQNMLFSASVTKGNDISEANYKNLQKAINKIDIAVLVVINNKISFYNKGLTDLLKCNIKDDLSLQQLCIDYLNVEVYQYIQKNDSGKTLLNNDKLKNIEIKFNTINDKKNSQKHKIITFVDISDKKDLEKQIIFSQRLQTIGQIASSVAHDFNNLLTAIMSFAYFLRERYTDDDPSTVELEQIQQNANRAKVMIRQLLTFSRGKELNPVSFAVNSEVSNLMSTILRLMGENVKASFKRGKNIGKTMMDPTQFQQILINLAVNARDAMKKGGNLSIATDLIRVKKPIEGVISTIPPGEYILISISDEGEGIKKENLRKIFQIHFSTKGDKGNGLGLATVAKILQENNGYIDVKSVVGKGTTFNLYLHPVEISNEEIKVATVKFEAMQDTTGSGTILLVEDEIPVRMVCKKILVNKGYNVLEAADADIALSLLQKKENKVDLIISDVMMPGMSGPEFVAKVREDKPNLRAILMSGYAEDILEDDDYALEHIDFLSKPFSPDVLASKVKESMNKSVR